MLAASADVTRRRTGIRPVSLHADLSAIAALMEVCFSPGLDPGGLAAIREMRALGSLGLLLYPMARLDSMLQGIGHGLVWEESGQIVGNVTLHEADLPPECGRTTVIANVAVHPDLRRRGIARALMLAAMQTIRERGGTAALQVEADNDPARRLYDSLGFRTERTWIHWRRPANLAPPPRLPDAPPITLRPPGRWQDEYALAARAFPPEQGGLGWLRPLHAREFRRSAARQIADLLMGRGLERWVVPGARGEIAASLWADTSFASAATRLTLLVPPEQQGRLDLPLLIHAARVYGDTGRPLLCEHPADAAGAAAAFERLGFVRRRALTHMRWEPG